MRVRVDLLSVVFFVPGMSFVGRETVSVMLHRTTLLEAGLRAVARDAEGL